MVFPIPSLPSDRILHGRDLAIIACQRKDDIGTDTHNRTFGVRWASRPDIGFPLGGYLIESMIDGGSPEPIGSDDGFFHLPLTDNWTVFAHEMEDRRPLLGPYFIDSDIREDNFGYLRPLIRLVDPRTPDSELLSLVLSSSAFFGSIHEQDAELASLYWPGQAAPAINQLLSSSTTSTRITEYYISQTVGYLLALALRFEYAVLLGLATDDFISKGTDIIYRVSGDWKFAGGAADSEPVTTSNLCKTLTPDDFRAYRVPGSVAHPTFNDFNSWVAPVEILSQDSNGNLQIAESLIPKAPTSISALEWSAPPPSGRLIDHLPVLYDLSRFGHGAVSAGLTNTPPPPGSQDYQPLQAGELLVRPEHAPHALDRPGLPWPPMEGFYHYQLRGVNLLAVYSAPVITAIRHHDDIPPPAPGVRLVDEATPEFGDTNSTIDLDLEIDWQSAHDFIGPDVVEFRISTRWLPRQGIAVHLEDVVADSTSELVDGLTLTGIATLDQIPGTPNALAGVRLIVPDGEHVIVDHQVGQHAEMRINRVTGRLPQAGQDGIILAPGSALPARRIARFDRRPAVSAFINAVSSVDPLQFQPVAAGTQAIPVDKDFSIYLHLLRTTFQAISTSAGVWQIEKPVPGDIRRDAWDFWQSLSDPRALLTGSPAIIFPNHSVTVPIAPPQGFEAGLLMVDVTAVDDTTYVNSPALLADDTSLANLKGNESTPFTVTLSARLLTPPDEPEVPAFDPARFIWASSAAIYAENASYRLTWTPVTASHYEIWRTLEGALEGATPSTSDTDLRTLAQSQGNKFDMQSLKVFAPRFEDLLPGRAPTRTIYKVRAVSMSGIPGPWSDLIGPVHVPDVRRPPAPNICQLVVPKSAIPNPVISERELAVAWTQAGPKLDLRFDIEMKNTTDGTWLIVGTIPRNTMTGLDQLYQYVISGLTPGEKRQVRIRAVREARDPIDPLGVLRREIFGPPSEIRTGRATGNLYAPDNLASDLILNGPASGIRLNWDNRDPYKKIEILRQGPDEYFLRRIAAIEAGEQSYEDLNVISGQWRYQVRALGHSRKAESDALEVDLP